MDAIKNFIDVFADPRFFFTATFGALIHDGLEA